ncbi:MAG: hypothetical protein WC662_03685 [Candidatus Paceibacterota bacterium]|jgi:hypothetical protein
MKENLEFENLKQMYEGIPSNKRPKDIFIEGKSIFEQSKTPAQVEIIKTSCRLVYEYLKKINIKNKPFDQNRIAFLPQKFFTTNAEYHNADFCVLEESAEANLSSNIHELTHAQAAEWRNYEEKELEKYLEENDKVAKSGFHRHNNFKTINEGITEKITRQIIQENPKEYERLRPMFDGRMEEAIAKQEKIFNEEILPKVILGIKNDVEKEKNSFEIYKQKYIENMAKIDKLIIDAENEDERDFYNMVRKEEEISLKLVTDRHQEMIKMIEEREKIEREKNFIRIENIKFNYTSKPGDGTVYDFNVAIIDNLVDGIAKYNVKNNCNLDLSQEKEQVWEELQRAYFQGNTMYLRKIDEVFGRGFLRRIDEVHVWPYREEEEKFLKELKSKVDNI